MFQLATIFYLNLYSIYLQYILLDKSLHLLNHELRFIRAYLLFLHSKPEGIDQNSDRFFDRYLICRNNCGKNNLSFSSPIFAFGLMGKPLY